jgi:hypothetical protein
MGDQESNMLSERQWLEIIRLDEARNAQEHQDILRSIVDSSVPLGDDLLARLLRLSPTDAEHALQGHCGFVLSERRDHYKASLAIMFTSLSDLDEVLANFEILATSENPEIMLPKSRARLQTIEEKIQKELFAVASAAASLVDHVRRLQSRFEVPGFYEHLQRAFGSDGLHELVMGLRVLLHHLHIVKTGWSLSSDFMTGQRNAGFKIDRAELGRAIDQSGDRFRGKNGDPIRSFLESCPNQIDIRRLFLEYRSRLKLFYDWLNERVDIFPPAALQDYDRCVLEKNRYSSRLTWSALIGNWLNWERVPDVHKHLPNFLSESQYVAVYNLPRNSVEQVDLIISILDKHGAADEKLRSRIYELFARLSKQDEA